jgi:hypothetical protein
VHKVAFVDAKRHSRMNALLANSLIIIARIWNGDLGHPELHQNKEDGILQVLKRHHLMPNQMLQLWKRKKVNKLEIFRPMAVG